MQSSSSTKGDKIQFVRSVMLNALNFNVMNTSCLYLLSGEQLNTCYYCAPIFRSFPLLLLNPYKSAHIKAYHRHVEPNSPHPYTALLHNLFLNRMLHMWSRAFWMGQISHRTQLGNISFAKCIYLSQRWWGFLFTWKDLYLSKDLVQIECLHRHLWDNSTLWSQSWRWSFLGNYVGP